ncbi:hypothetical protein KY290_034644 [Solanum tuberosum]|uniref:RNase H type-1 domain-containing protein n=1 Tax=Solanum tuberosum TaxID=4113 RepID=A0ABQ7U5I6_SOLTU|nr:hypothetical protein KY289_034015 [Solanum tuberosum]KAH0741601.1 hypothetical protein KY290_034644 [Solanum tuberosum]
MTLMRATEFKHMTDSPIISPNRIDIKIRWFPPTTNAFKLNIDRAFYKDSQMGGIGGVIRNSHGNWVAGFREKIYALTHVMAELKALETGLQVALDRLLLRRLGNPVLRHNFRQGNKLADFLAKEGSKLNTTNETAILETTPPGATPILQADKDGVVTNRQLSVSTSTKLAMFGNQNVLRNDVTSTDAIITSTVATILEDRDATISPTNVVMF